MKSRFVAYYDYGMGGVILFVYAREPSEITQKYPELSILSSLPAWVTPEHEAKIGNARTFDIDATPTGFLEALVHERTKR